MWYIMQHVVRDIAPNKHYSTRMGGLHMDNPLPFLTFSLLAIFTPGPNNIMALCIAGKYGFKRCMPFNFGVTVGFLLLMAACIAFSYALYGALPGIKPVMTIIGAAYMLFLAYKTLRPGKAGSGAKRDFAGFPAGVLLQFVNPKGILFCITVASSYLVPYAKGVLPMAGYMLLLEVFILLSTCMWAAFGAVFQRVIERHNTVFNIVMAVLLLYCAISLFF